MNFHLDGSERGMSRQKRMKNAGRQERRAKRFAGKRLEQLPLLQHFVTKAGFAFKCLRCRAWKQERADGYPQNPPNTEIKSLKLSAAHLFASTCLLLIRLDSQNQPILHETAPAQKTPSLLGCDTRAVTHSLHQRKLPGV